MNYHVEVINITEVDLRGTVQDIEPEAFYDELYTTDNIYDISDEWAWERLEHDVTLNDAIAYVNQFCDIGHGMVRAWHEARDGILMSPQDGWNVTMFRIVDGD